MITGLLLYIKAAVAVFASVMLYIIALKLAHSKTIKILPAFLFAISGILFICVYNKTHELVITFISIGCILSLLATLLSYRQCKSIVAAVVLLLANVFIVPLLLLGYNPYTLIKADNVHHFGCHDGVYEYSYNGKIGLRDRFGVIIPADNQKMYFLDDACNYVAVLEDDKGWRKGEYGVYSLAERRFVVDACAGIAKIEKINEVEYKMIDCNDRHFATFSIPANIHAGINKNVEFKAHFSNVETPLDDFLSQLNEEYEIDPGNNVLWQEMKAHNPEAYDLLCKLIAMSDMESSPANDLSYASAFAIIIKNDNYYNGNYNKAFRELDELLDIIGCGNQSDLNTCATLCRLIECVKLFTAYNSLISIDDIINCEYIAWHKLMEAIVSYYEQINDRLEWYSGKPMDMEFEKASWLEKRNNFIDIESNIIRKQGCYVCQSDSILTIDDAKQVIDNYHCEYNPKFYHPMYYEIQPAFEEWLNARQLVSKSLSREQAQSYREVTKELESEYAGIIKSLDRQGLQPALNRKGKPD